jgi:probable HAF family extracellular repeat protein
MTDLGTLGGRNSEGWAINDNGQVTGFSDVARGSHAFLYSGGTITDLGTLGGRNSQGLDINDSGHVTGGAEVRSGESHVFLYSGGSMADLGPGEGTAINNSGQITGGASVGSGYVHAFLYSGGSRTDLGTLGGGSSVGLDINDRGQVTGISDIDGASHAFLYSGGTMTDLGTLGGRYSEGWAINASGQVTGMAETAMIGSQRHAFLYSDGIMYDLNDHISDGLPPGVYLGIAGAINDRGWIVATGNDHISYVLQPVPEPGSLALFAIGAGVLIVLRISRPQLTSKRPSFITPAPL